MYNTTIFTNLYKIGYVLYSKGANEEEEEQKREGAIRIETAMAEAKKIEAKAVAIEAHLSAPVLDISDLFINLSAIEDLTTQVSFGNFIEHQETHEKIEKFSQITSKNS
ncbi:hypothetical protein COB57_00610 [Candidatus Peregrinibacteria bacterium]|nr:MAG: hypothetical protein COB57_00610 [Candidatus Peregrinibacteria bacterium]